jgi:hypothetical protein
MVKFRLWCLCVYLQVIRNLQTAFADRPEVVVMVAALSESFESLYKAEVCYSCLSLYDLAFYVQGCVILAYYIHKFHYGIVNVSQSLVFQ